MRIACTARKLAARIAAAGHELIPDVIDDPDGVGAAR
jgi:hypothetical protein